MLLVLTSSRLIRLPYFRQFQLILLYRHTLLLPFQHRGTMRLPDHSMVVIELLVVIATIQAVLRQQRWHAILLVHKFLPYLLRLVKELFPLVRNRSMGDGNHALGIIQEGPLHVVV